MGKGGPRKYKAHGSRTSGFTLLEMLVVLALLSLVLGLAFAAFRMTNSVAQRVDNATANADDIVAVEGFLRALLEKTYPAVVHVGPTHYRLSFDGTSDRVEFTSILPHHFAFGYQRMVLRVVNRANKRQLVLAWDVERNNANSLLVDPARHEAVILPDVASIALSYFGVRSRQGGPSWHGTWIDATRLPTLVRLLIFPSGARQPWPALDIPLPIDVDSTCTVDLLTHRCEGR